MSESSDLPAGPSAPSAPTAPTSRSAKLVPLLLGGLALGLGLRVPLAGGRGFGLGVILGLVAGAVGLVLALGARTQALRAQEPLGLYTAAVAIAVAGTLVCSLWVVLLLGVGSVLHGVTG